MKSFICSITLALILMSACAPATTVAPSPIPDTQTPTSQLVPLQKTYKDMVVGFVEGYGAEWVNANRDSFRLTAIDLGIRVYFYETENPGPITNQERAFRAFMDQPEVNVIVIAPQKPTGWDEMFKEAHARGKVVVVEGWPIAASQDLYDTYVGPDLVNQGRKAGQAMSKLLEGSQKKNVWELVGPIDSNAAQDRGQGFREATQGSGLIITQSQTANWTRGEGKKVMAAFLEKGKDVQGLFAQNDEMALGAIEAIQEAGLKPGVDIKIVTIDGTSAGLQAMLSGDLNAIAEFNPFLAPQVYEAALKALNGETLPRWIVSKEGIYDTPLQAQNELQRRQAEGFEW